MSDSVEELTYIQTQLESERKIMLDSMSATTTIVLAIYWAVAFSIWFVSEPNVSLFTLWMDEEYYLLIPSGIAVFICMLLGVIHHYWLRYYWDRQYNLAQAIITTQPSFSDLFHNDKLLGPFYKAKDQKGWGSAYLRTRPNELLDRINLNGAFLVMLTSESQSGSEWEHRVLTLAHSDFQATRAGNTFMKLHRWMNSISIWVWVCCAPFLLIPVFLMVIWLCIVYPFQLQGWHPCLRRNASARAIVENLLAE